MILNRLKINKFPLILQAEQAECGLACVAMISGYFGHELDFIDFRAKYKKSDRGSTLKDLMQISNLLGLNNKALKVDLTRIKEIEMPCILHWNSNHFVVLKKIINERFLINDPAEGELFLTKEEFSQCFTGFILTLSPSDKFEFKNAKRKSSFKAILPNIKKYKNNFIWILILSIVLQTLVIISPLYLQFTIDNIAADKNQLIITYFAIGFAFLLLMQMVFSVIREVTILKLSKLLHIEMADIVFRHLLRMPFSFFSNRQVGDTVSRFGSLKEIRNLLTSNFIVAIVDGLMLIGTFGFMVFYASYLALTILFIAVVYTILRFYTYPKQKQLANVEIMSSAKHDSHFIETIQSVKTIKALDLEQKRYDGWQPKIINELDNFIKLSIFNLWIGTARDTLFNLLRIGVIYVLCLMVIANAFTVGMLLAFIGFFDRFIGCFISVIDRFFELKMLGLHFERLSDIVDFEDNISEINSKIQPKKIEGFVNIRNLSYSYESTSLPLFDNLNIDIVAGESVAIVGSSGTGKTTLVLCILGLLKPTSGEILFDGYLLEEIKDKSKFISSVLQDDVLFNGSVLNNISSFDDKPDLDMVYECAKLACIHDDIISMPMKYETIIGDMGSGFSGGQRQRIMLARALYKKPKILVLDESTSNLDIFLEKKINENIRNLNVTQIIVAHRPETINAADRVIKWI